MVHSFNPTQSQIAPFQKPCDSPNLLPLPDEIIENDERTDYNSNQVINLHQRNLEEAQEQLKQQSNIRRENGSASLSPGGVQGTPFKAFSQQIRGSTRAPTTSEFVSTRLQQKATQIQQVQLHVVTNAKMREDIKDLFSTKKGKDQKLMQAMQQIIQPSLGGKNVEKAREFDSIFQAAVDMAEDLDFGPRRGRHPAKAGEAGELRVKTSQFSRPNRHKIR